MSEGKTLYKILSREKKHSDKTNKDFEQVTIIDNQGTEFKTSFWDPIPKTSFIRCIMVKSKDGKYWNVTKLEESTESFTAMQTSTTSAPVQAPQSDDEKLEKDYYDQILKSGKFTVDQLEMEINSSMNELGVKQMPAIKLIAKNNNIELKAPETKEEKIDRMAKQRDELVEKQIKSLDRLSIALEQAVVRMLALETALGAAKIVGGK